MGPVRIAAVEATNPSFPDARVVLAAEAMTAELPGVIAWPGEGDLELAEATTTSGPVHQAVERPSATLTKALRMQTSSRPPAPVGTDAARASLSRVYDFFLGGTYAYEIEREIGRALQDVAADVGRIFVDERDFVVRACRYLAERNLASRFLVGWAGFPHREVLHDVVLRANADATVGYLARDPLVLANLRVEMDAAAGAYVVDADVLAPGSVLQHGDVVQALDEGEPICLVLAGIWSHADDVYGDPAKILRQYIDAVPAGSYVVSTWLADPGADQGGAAARIVETMRHSALGSGRTFTHKEMAAATAGLEILPADLADDDPGPVPCFTWWENGTHIDRRGDAMDSGLVNIGVVGRTTRRQV